MKKLMLSVVVIMLLSGCAKSSWETISDPPSAVAVSSQLGEIETVAVQVPDEIKLIETMGTWCIYATDAGDLEIETRTVLASSLDSAVSTLSGFRSDDLDILNLQSGDKNDYRFAWVTSSDEGNRVCRAKVIQNGMLWHAVVCSVSEDVGNIYEEQIRDVFATAYICSGEGV